MDQAMPMTKYLCSYTLYIWFFFRLVSVNTRATGQPLKAKFQRLKKTEDTHT